MLLNYLSDAGGDWIPAPYGGTGQAFRRYDGGGGFGAQAAIYGLGSQGQDGFQTRPYSMVFAA